MVSLPSAFQFQSLRIKKKLRYRHRIGLARHSTNVNIKPEFYASVIFRDLYENQYDWFSARVLLKRQNNIEIMKMIETFPAATGYS